MTRYYTMTPSGPVFQMRLPARLARRFNLASISVPIPTGPKRAIRNRALALATRAKQVFAMFDQVRDLDLTGFSREDLSNLIQMSFDTLTGGDDAHCGATDAQELPEACLAAPPTPCEGDETPAWMPPAMLAFRAMGELLDRPQPVESLHERTRYVPLAGLCALDKAHKEGRCLITPDADDCLFRLFTAALDNDDLLARLAGLSPLDPPQPSGQANARPVARAPEPEPRFSDAIAAYCADLAQRKGPTDKNIQNLKLRAGMFTALIGDPPLSEVTNGMLRRFGYAISFLPAALARKGQWTPATLRDILIANGWTDVSSSDDPLPAHRPIRQQTISQKTVKDKTLGPIVTALQKFAGDRGITLRVQRFRFALPKHTPRARHRDKPASAKVARFLAAGRQDGRLVQAMLPLLLALTGRRLGQIAFLRAEHLRDMHGHYQVQIPATYWAAGQQKFVPIKNEEAETPFILHELFTEIGFIDFIRKKQNGWVFESLHQAGIADPAGTAQKRLSAVLARARIDMVSHHLRHFAIGNLSNTSLDSKFRRMQVGHAAASIHEKYARNWEPVPVDLIAKMDLPSEIDWQAFRSFDFTRAEQLCLGRAKRHQRQRRR